MQNPVEGTILTVARAAADAASATPASGAGLVAVLEAARQGAADALARTPDLLPVLKTAGVVDAGGAGFVLLLDAFLHVADRPALARLPGRRPRTARARPLGRSEPRSGRRRGAGLALRGHVPARSARRVAPAVPRGVGRSGRLDRRGGRRRPVELPHPHRRHRRRHRGRRWRPAGPAASGSPTCGSRSRRSAGCGRRPVPTAEAEPTPEPVRCAVGRGLHRRGHPAHLPVAGRPPGGERRPVDEPVHRRPARRHRRRPRRAGGDPAQQQQHRPRRRTGRPPGRPSRSGSSPPAASRRASRPCSSTTPKATPTPTSPLMSESAGRVVAGEVTRAVRASVCDAGPIAEGDYLGLSRQGHRGRRAPTWPRRPPACSSACIDADHHEIVTIIAGEGAGAADTRRITEWIAAQHPGADQRGAPRGPAAVPLPLLIDVARSARGAASTVACEVARTDSRPRPASGGDRGRPAQPGRARSTATPSSAMGIDSVLDLVTHYPRRYIDRTNQADIADLVDGQEAMVLGEVRRSYGPAHPAGADAGRGRPVRRLELPVAHVLQPALAGQAAERGHPGGGVRQGRALSGPAPDDESGRRPGRRPDRPDRPGVSAVGEGRA